MSDSGTANAEWPDNWTLNQMEEHLALRSDVQSRLAAKAIHVLRLRLVGAHTDEGVARQFDRLVHELAEAKRALARAQERGVELDFAAERALEMLQSGRHYDAEATLERVLGNGSCDVQENP